MHPTINSRPRDRRAAFTLTELLVVIVIVAVLAAILLPVISKIRQKATAASGASTMRQIGMASLLYATDNRHIMPGPLAHNQRSVYKFNNYQLATRIAPYLGMNDNLPSNTPIKAMLPRAFDRFGLEPHEATLYFVNAHVKIANMEGEFAPAGYPGQTSPIKYSLVDMPESQVFLIEMDTLLKDRTGRVIGQGLPEPLHGGFRHALFFDWHVEAIPLDKNFYAVKRW